mmetsp:Transcript_26258/g.56914  ORF Transcript_26258/g.56914 Transcript_26258/m.56914 type:complete len:203 (-) Transcript_26258:791-1399(-)
MEHVGRMDVLQSSEELVQKVLDVIKGERLLRVDDPMKIGLHQLVANVDVVEVFDVPRKGRHHVGNTNNIFMMEVLEELDLTEDALGIDLVVEGAGDHLDGDLGLGRRVQCRNDDAVGTGTNDTDEGVLGIDREGLITSLEGVGVVGGVLGGITGIGHPNGTGWHYNFCTILGNTRRAIIDGVGMSGSGRRGGGGGVMVRFIS